MAANRKRTTLTRIALTTCVALMAVQTFVVAAARLDGLVRGKDSVDVPAIGQGLCLHNLFQSNLAIRKDSRNRPVYDYKTIMLSSRHVTNLIRYRYAWGRNPMGNLKPWIVRWEK